VISLIVHIVAPGEIRGITPYFVRKLSYELFDDKNSPDDYKTMAMAFWTIFVGHDLSHTAISRMSKNNTKPYNILIDRY